ncbi:hypothetical protein K435DRAFT_558557, partial [Dendrothele bispora CBS 962.96]
LRKHSHFGEEDPLYFPQPFSPSLPHLALIPLPSVDETNKHRIAWYHLHDSDFILVSPEDESGSSGGLGVITSTVRANMQRAIDAAKERLVAYSHSTSVPDGPNITNIEDDKYLRDYSCSLQWLMAQLNCACTRTRSQMAFALVQRIYLEMIARIDWLIAYKPLYNNMNFTVKRPEKVARVVGALVGNVETAEHLWRLGIPLWLVRDMKTKDPSLRVDKWLAPGDPAGNLALRTGGFQLSMEEAEPPNPNVWTGMLNISKFDQYTAMSQLLRRSATAHLYEEESQPTPSASQPSTASLRSSPRKRVKVETTTLPPPPPPTVRSKFVEVDSDVMPSAIRAWRDASQTVGQHFNANAYSSPLGYFLPDPQMIAGLGRDTGNF